jgi:hypothetical protein
MKANSRAQLVRVAGWCAYASGLAAISSMVPFVTILVFGVNIPRLNDRAVIVQYLLALPITVALHHLVRAQAPLTSTLALLSGIVGLLGIAVVQVFWLSEAFGVTTYYLLLTVAFLLVGAWLVVTGQYLGRSIGPARHSLLMSILAATYVGYPIWAIWLGRLFLSGKLTIADPATRRVIA